MLHFCCLCSLLLKQQDQRLKAKKKRKKKGGVKAHTEVLTGVCVCVLNEGNSSGGVSCGTYLYASVSNCCIILLCKVITWTYTNVIKAIINTVFVIKRFNIKSHLFKK